MSMTDSVTVGGCKQIFDQEKDHMKGIILAAGDGGRLRPLTDNMPKVLLELGGRPMIRYSIDAMEMAGVSDIAVVVGYQHHKVVDILGPMYPHITFIYNEHYLGGNAISVYSARYFVKNEPFLVCMGDHPISPDITRHLLSEYREGCVLCVDPEAWLPSQINDATRVLVAPGGNVVSIGKNLKVWNAIDTGVFKMTEEFIWAVESLMKTQGVQVSITDAVRAIERTGRAFSTCDVGGMFWADVDTLEDYQSIDSMLGRNNGDSVRRVRVPPHQSSHI